ncbi:MAG TPA: hypothetical protein PK156_33785, partial [Polyangium sp.]|nr:hypothetical protein [Polyangium sp.]
MHRGTCQLLNNARIGIPHALCTRCRHLVDKETIAASVQVYNHLWQARPADLGAIDTTHRHDTLSAPQDTYPPADPCTTCTFSCSDCKNSSHTP